MFWTQQNMEEVSSLYIRCQIVIVVLNGFKSYLDEYNNIII